MSARAMIEFPLIREALALNGFTIDQVMENSHWQTMKDPFVTSAIRKDLPFMLFDAESGVVDWGRNPCELRIRKKKDGHAFFLTLFSPPKFPEAIKAISVGLALDKIINLPGASEVVIDSMQESDSDFSITLRLSQRGN